jgi:GT2 family glycosyltransferase
MSRVAICVITYRRPTGLARLLRAIGELEFRSAPPPAIEVVVVDNDEQRTAEMVCTTAAAQIPWPIRYETEPRRGIPMARNAALRSVRSRCDFVAFVDDDEEPAPDWLDELLKVQRQYRSEIVSGPVLPRFEAAPAAWMLAGGFYNRPRYLTGHRLRHAATNNVLIDGKLFVDAGFTFDERLALRGGEDTHFFLRTSGAGYSIVWANDAVVYEWIPPARMTARWLLRRSYRVGNTWSFCERDLSGTPWTVGMRVMKAGARIAGGICMLPLSLLAGHHATMAALRHVWQGAGYLTGLLGVSFEEYRMEPDL